MTRGLDSLTGDPDADLVRAAAAGDVDAFETLVRRYQSRVVSLVRATVAPGDDAEDLAQDVFVRVYRSLGSFRGECAFRTWLYKVTLNVARSHGTRWQRLRATWGDRGTTDEDAFDTPDAIDLEAHLITRDAVERALQALPEDLRVAITLRDVHGLEYRDIADATGTPMGTVESRIFRARQRLRVLLAGVGPRTRERTGVEDPRRRAPRDGVPASVKQADRLPQDAGGSARPGDIAPDPDARGAGGRRGA